jgi:hypothetical protein
MSRKWVLDTETKGTGAQMVPLEKVLERRAGKPARRPVPPRAEQPAPAPEPAQPRRFRVVDAVTRRVLAEDADTRATVDLLGRTRSIVDVAIYVWNEPSEKWLLLTFAEAKMLWNLRGRGATARATG